MELLLKKWGNSQGIRLPKSILEELGITTDNNVTFDINVKDKTLVLKPKKESKLAQRFKGFDYEKYWADWDKEHPNESKEIDWGEPVGKEFKW